MLDVSENLKAEFTRRLVRRSICNLSANSGGTRLQSFCAGGSSSLLNHRSFAKDAGATNL